MVYTREQVESCLGKAPSREKLEKFSTGPKVPVRFRSLFDDIASAFAAADAQGRRSDVIKFLEGIYVLTNEHGDAYVLSVDEKKRRDDEARQALAQLQVEQAAREALERQSKQDAEAASTRQRELEIAIALAKEEQARQAEEQARQAEEQARQAEEQARREKALKEAADKELREKDREKEEALAKLQQHAETLVRLEQDARLNIEQELQLRTEQQAQLQADLDSERQLRTSLQEQLVVMRSQFDELIADLNADIQSLRKENQHIRDEMARMDAGLKVVGISKK